MRKNRLALAVAMAFPFAFSAHGQTSQITSAAAPAAPVKSLGVVTVSGSQPTSLPTQIPTTMEGITREQIEQTVNATDSEDALKYFPSLLVRKRYIGDYNHAVLSSRASGTGNSARSAVYADGILLSNYLGNGVGGLSFPPRWGLVTPEEIERVDVMYGPFSAAYPGNSVGAVVDYVTRMPTRLEAHGKAGAVSQPFSLYGTNASYRAWQTSASAGNRNGDWAWFLNFNHTDSHGQPTDGRGTVVSHVGGKTRLQSLYVQDGWVFMPGWKAVLGARAEQWTASQGYTQIPGAVPAVNTQWPERREFNISPKAAVSWQFTSDVVLKASTGRAVRNPTVSELYGATATANSQYTNDPGLKPEKSWTSELSVEKDPCGQLQTPRG
ncbi:MAG: TonB-dependent receptor, partial [Bdellovibrionales bacterium]|nr:TonB-dependent receptor [Ramlibacter sp.]